METPKWRRSPRESAWTQVSPMALGVLGVSRSQATAQAGKPRPEGAVRLNPVSVPATAHSATQALVHPSVGEESLPSCEGTHWKTAVS